MSPDTTIVRVEWSRNKSGSTKIAQLNATKPAMKYADANAIFNRDISVMVFPTGKCSYFNETWGFGNSFKSKGLEMFHWVQCS
jgi:hypothetical protein